MEFSSKNGETKRVAGTPENEYTISVNAPGEYRCTSLNDRMSLMIRYEKSKCPYASSPADMPAGVVSLTMYTGPSSVSLGPVTYYTIMGEVSRYLEKAVDPVTFICQVEF